MRGVINTPFQPFFFFFFFPAITLLNTARIFVLSLAQNPSPQSTPGSTGRNSESELPGFDEQKLWLVMREGGALKSKLLADQMNFDHDAKESRRVLTGRLASSSSSLVIIIMVEPL